jgi:hypothetical protein
MAELVITRLMQNPLGQIAPAGHRGDIIRVSDGAATVYLLPAEFDALDDEQLRAKLSQAPYRALADTAVTIPTKSARPQTSGAPGPTALVITVAAVRKVGPRGPVAERWRGRYPRIVWCDGP